MPVTPTYPGIYIQEAPSSVHAITPAPTNIAAFIGYTHPLKTNAANFDKAVQIFGFADYQREFGGFLRSAAYANAGDAYLQTASASLSFGDMASAVSQFFLNGGTQAYVVGLLPSALNNLWVGRTLSPPGSVGPEINMSSNPPETIASVTGATLDVGGVTFTALEITDEKFVMTLTVRPIGSPSGEAQADVIITYGPGPAPQPGVQVSAGTVT
jgi:hypothetical protein